MKVTLCSSCVIYVQMSSKRTCSPKSASMTSNSVPFCDENSGPPEFTASVHHYPMSQQAVQSDACNNGGVLFDQFRRPTAPAPSNRAGNAKPVCQSSTRHQSQSSDLSDDSLTSVASSVSHVLSPSLSLSLTLGWIERVPSLCARRNHTCLLFHSDLRLYDPRPPRSM